MTPPHPPNLLCLLPIIRQDVTGALQQVVSEEQPSERVLNTSAHLNQVLQNVLTRLGEGADVHHPHGDEQISVGGRTEQGGFYDCLQRCDGGTLLSPAVL